MYTKKHENQYNYSSDYQLSNFPAFKIKNTIFKMVQSQNLVQTTVAQKLLIIQTFVPVYDL